MLLFEDTGLIRWKLHVCTRFYSKNKPSPAPFPSECLLVKLGAGLIKLRGDACWQDLTCMDYHYETQPNPNPLSRYLHYLPSDWWVGDLIGEGGGEGTMDTITCSRFFSRITVYFSNVSRALIVINGT